MKVSPNMQTMTRYEHVVYQNPYLALRIWQIDDSNEGKVAESLQRAEYEWKHQVYDEWHYHEEVELLLIVRGGLIAYCPGERLVLKQGDVAIFGSSEPHTTHIGPENDISHIVFQLNLRQYWDTSTIGTMPHFAEIARPLSALNYIFREQPAVRDQVASLISAVYNEMNGRQIGYELAVSAHIKLILALLLRHDTRRQLHYSDHELTARLRPVLDYIDLHLGEKVSVADLSEMMSMSYTHFVKTFKRAVGMSFSDYIIHKRIKKSEQQLATTNASIQEVAEAVGISNMGHFYSLFRRCNGCSPKQFRAKLREKQGAD